MVTGQGHEWLVEKGAPCSQCELLDRFDIFPAWTITKRTVPNTYIDIGIMIIAYAMQCKYLT